MSDKHAEADSKEGWVAFSDILLSTICSVLFMQTLVAAQHTKGAEEAQRFEERLCGVEREAVAIDALTKASALEVKELSRALNVRSPADGAAPLQPRQSRKSE